MLKFSRWFLFLFISKYICTSGMVPQATIPARLPKIKHELAVIIANDQAQLLLNNPIAQIAPNTFLGSYGSYTLLTFAIERNSNNCAHVLITRLKADVNMDDKICSYTRRERCPLALALKNNNYTIADTLFEHGAHLIVKDLFAAMPLLFDYIRCMNDDGSNLTRIQWLLKQGSDPHYTFMYADKSNNNYLQYALSLELPLSFLVTFTELLLHAGFDIDHENNRQQTCLHTACAQKQPNLDFIAYLLHKAANPEIKDSRGKKPIDYARQPEVIAMLDNPKSVVLPESIRVHLDQDVKLSKKIL